MKIHRLIIMTLVVLGATFIAIGFAQDKKSSDGSISELKSTYLEETDDQAYREIKPPEDPILLRWDFSGDKEYSYDYFQEVLVISDMAGAGPGKEVVKQDYRINGSGILSYRSEKDNTARFVLENMKMRAMMEDGPDGGPRSVKIDSSPIVVQGVKEDGKLSISSGDQVMLLKLLFPLPEKPMKISETFRTEVSMPFKALGSLLIVKGHSETTFSKFVNIWGHKCAKLVSEIDITEMDVPPEMKGLYVASAKGKSVFFFDVENRKFITGRLALLMSMKTDTESQKAKVTFSKGETEKIAAKIKMSMDSDNLITLDIKK